MQRIIVITGTDTGVGKTVLTALLAAHLVRKEAKVAALKPICSGGRSDARLLSQALGSKLALDTINPWHFRAPVAPLLAARAEKRTVSLSESLAHIRTVSRARPRPEYVLIEGAGGLLSPLGEGFNTRDWIAGLGAESILVGANRLGVVNQLLLTLNALPAKAASTARIVLMSEPKPDRASGTNARLLAEFIAESRLTVLPHFPNPNDFDSLLARPAVSKALEELLR